MKKLLVAIALVLSIASVAEAATFSGSAAVDISGVPITINPVSPFNFGTLTKPTTSGASFRVSSDGSKTAVNITQTNTAAVQPASLTIDAPSSTVHLGLTDGTTAPGLSLSNFDFKYNGVQYTTASSGGLSSGLAIPVTVGAQLNVDPSTPLGITHATYNVSADYE